MNNQKINYLKDPVSNIFLMPAVFLFIDLILNKLDISIEFSLCVILFCILASLWVPYFSFIKSNRIVGFKNKYSYVPIRGTQITLILFFIAFLSIKSVPSEQIVETNGDFFPQNHYSFQNSFQNPILNPHPMYSNFYNKNYYKNQQYMSIDSNTINQIIHSYTANLDIIPTGNNEFYPSSYTRLGNVITYNVPSFNENTSSVFTNYGNRITSFEVARNWISSDSNRFYSSYPTVSGNPITYNVPWVIENSSSIFNHITNSTNNDATKNLTTSGNKGLYFGYPTVSGDTITNDLPWLSRNSSSITNLRSYMQNFDSVKSTTIDYNKIFGDRIDPNNTSIENLSRNRNTFGNYTINNNVITLDTNSLLYKSIRLQR